MSDGQTLLCILAAVYLTDCFVWVRRHSLAFVALWGRAFKPALPSAVLGNSEGGIVLLNPLPPLGTVFVSHLLPVSFSPTAVCSFNSQSLASMARPKQPALVREYAEVKSVRASGTEILINGELFARARTQGQAADVAGAIEEIARAEGGAREGLIEGFLGRAFDRDAAAETLSRVRRETMYLRVLCNLLFVFLFAVATALGLWMGAGAAVLLSAPVAFALGIVITVRFHAAHKALCPREKEERLTSVIKMALCPPVAVRAVDIVTANALAASSPLVAADLLAGGAAFRQLAARVILDLRHPIGHELSDPRARGVIAWHNSRLAALCERYAREVAREDLGLERAPAPSEASSRRYCPRCRAEFSEELEECPDCPGVATAAFGMGASGEIHNEQ